MIPPDEHLIDGAVWRLSRAWPRGEEVPLELVGPEGRSMVGRWFPDERRAARELGRTPGALAGDDPRLVLHPAGADRKLPRVAAAVAAGGELVAHRPHRRAVVRMAGSGFLKFTRPGRARTLGTRHHQMGDALRGLAEVPTILAVDDDHLALRPLPGATPIDLVHDLTSGEWRAMWEQVGRVVGRLGRTPAPSDLPDHGAVTEAEVTRGWVDRAVAAGRLPHADVDRLLVPLRVAAGANTSISHRDLHDGQLLVDGSTLGLLDPDTLARAEPALDLANLLVHLDLRVDQGLLDPSAAALAKDALLDGADPTPSTRRRLSAYELSCRLRLSAVYAFRPAWADLARRWYAQALAPVAEHGSTPTRSSSSIR